jgi:lysophospholipase L1-like esterase
LGRGFGRGFLRRASARTEFVFRTAAHAILVAILIAAFATSVRGSDDFPQVADPDPARFEKDIAAFEHWDRQNSFPRNAALFVGSSSIRMWPTAESFPNMPVINRGFGGSHISDVNHFAERIVLKYSPRLIVYYAGDNDIESGKSPPQVFEDFQAFTRLIHDRLPRTRIVYLPIKPSIARWPKWPQMQDVNARVAQLSRSDGRLIYVDTATPMLGDDGEPNGRLFLDDGLHLNERGYALWTKTLQPALEKAPITPARSASEGRAR